MSANPMGSFLLGIICAFMLLLAFAYIKDKLEKIKCDISQKGTKMSEILGLMRDFLAANVLNKEFLNGFLLGLILGTILMIRYKNKQDQRLINKLNKDLDRQKDFYERQINALEKQKASIEKALKSLYIEFLRLKSG